MCRVDPVQTLPPTMRVKKINYITTLSNFRPITHVVSNCRITTNDGEHCGRPGFNSWEGQETFLYSIAFRLALERTQPPIRWVPKAFSPGVKRRTGEVDDSSSSSAVVKNVELHLHSLIFFRGVLLNWVNTGKTSVTFFTFKEESCLSIY
jgi:hypothetical protein